ncbi:MAG: ribosome-binding factor A [Candidatus Pacebacteria bacterium]|nr:ribosome-binding factor A [Candidatus Paceibacterota bacterium]
MYDRHQRVESLIRELVAAFIQQEANTDPLITVTRITSSPDYRRMTVFFTTIPEGKEDNAIAFLKRTGGELRSYVKKKSNLKIIPFLEFSVDYGERHRQNIDEIAREIENKK